MMYHHMVPDPAYGLTPETPDTEFRRSVLFDGGDPAIAPPAYRFREHYAHRPAYPFSAGAGLMSPELRAILEAEIGSEDEIRWIQCTVLCDGQELNYAVPVDLAPPPKFDASQTDIGPSGVPARWALQSTGLKGRHVIKVPNLHSGLVVADPIRRAVEMAGLVGIEWLDARVS